jgi:hypothetical protein
VRDATTIETDRTRQAELAGFGLKTITAAALISLVTASEICRAEFDISGGGGASVGSFTTGAGKRATRGYDYSFAGNYHSNIETSAFPYSVGIAVRQAKFSYTESNVKKNATYNLFGPTVGYLAGTPEFYLHLVAEYYPSPILTALSKSSYLMNDMSYKHSTWQGFKCEPALGIRVNFTFEKSDGQFNKKNRLKSGFGITSLSQRITSQSLKINTSDSETRPKVTTMKSAVSYNLTLTGVDLFIGLAF